MRSRPSTWNSRLTDSPNLAERSIGMAPAFQPRCAGLGPDVRISSF